MLYVGPAQASDGDFLQQLEVIAKKQHVQTERVDSRALRRFHPMLHTGAGLSGILTRTRAGYLNPRRQIEANIRLLLTAGHTVVRQRVRSINSAGAALRLQAEHDAYLAEKVIVASGAYTNAIDYPGARLQLTPEKWSVMLAAVNDEAAEALAGLPCILYKPPDTDNHAYVLPPIRYPDGQQYLKIGYPFSDGLESDLSRLNEWFGNPVPTSQQTRLRRLLGDLFPEVTFDALRAEPCCGTQTPTGYPYIDFAADRRLVWLVGCNSYSAKSADELGRLAARLALDGRWTDTTLAADFFKARYA